MFINVVVDGYKMSKKEEIVGLQKDEKWFAKRNAIMTMYKSDPFMTLAADIGLLEEGNKSEVFVAVKDDELLKQTISRLRKMCEQEIKLVAYI